MGGRSMGRRGCVGLRIVEDRTVARGSAVRSEQIGTELRAHHCQRLRAILSTMRRSTQEGLVKLLIAASSAYRPLHLQLNLILVRDGPPQPSGDQKLKFCM
jgi:hypothetical protein